MITKERRIKMSWRDLGQIRIRTSGYSDEVHDGMVNMLKHLKAVGKVDLWKGLATGDLKPLDLYRQYVRDELDQVIKAESVKTAKAVMLEWAAGRSSPTTSKSYTEVINNLFRDHPDATIAELPQVLREVRERYAVNKQKNSFDQCRKVASSWAGQTFSKDSAIWRQLRGVPPLEESGHVHKQEARSVWDVFATVKAMGEPFGMQFLTMCLIGSGTKEYLVDGYSIERDEELGYDYVRIRGKKTSHRDRRVPLIFGASKLTKPSVTYANRRKFDKALQAVQPDWDLYDARRTFRHWCEMAGINEIRAKAYSGRNSLTTDEEYRRHNIDPYLVDDATLLRKYILANMQKPKPRTDIVEVPDLPEF